MRSASLLPFVVGGLAAVARRQDQSDYGYVDDDPVDLTPYVTSSDGVTWTVYPDLKPCPEDIASSISAGLLPVGYYTAAPPGYDGNEVSPTMPTDAPVAPGAPVYPPAEAGAGSPPAADAAPTAGAYPAPAGADAAPTAGTYPAGTDAAPGADTAPGASDAPGAAPAGTNPVQQIGDGQIQNPASGSNPSSPSAGAASPSSGSAGSSPSTSSGFEQGGSSSPSGDQSGTDQSPSSPETYTGAAAGGKVAWSAMWGVVVVGMVVGGML